MTLKVGTSRTTALSAVQEHHPPPPEHPKEDHPPSQPLTTASTSSSSNSNNGNFGAVSWIPSKPPLPNYSESTTSPIPEEEESIVSEGFQGDRIQVAVRLRPLPLSNSSSPDNPHHHSSKLLHLPRRNNVTISGNHAHKRSSSWGAHNPVATDSCSVTSADDHCSVSCKNSPPHSASSNPLPTSLSTPSPALPSSSWSSTSSWMIVNSNTLVLKNSRQSGIGGGPSLFHNNRRKKLMGSAANQFTVDQVFDETVDTRSVYREIGRPIVQAALTGRHGTLFAYGQTGSGKTFTLQGGTSSSGCTSGPEEQHEEQEGLIPLAMMDLFQAIHASTSRDWQVKVQYFEIYNEVLQDLIASTPPLSTSDNERRGSAASSTASRNTKRTLSSSSSTSSSSSATTSLWNGRLQSGLSSDQQGQCQNPKRRSKSQPLEQSMPARAVRRLATLKILEDGNGTVHVNAREQVVTSAEECVRLLRKGNRARAMAATDANQHSSRSHAIFRVALQSRPKPSVPNEPNIVSTPRPTSGSSAATTRWSVLNFVDLAGSENSGRALGSASAGSSASSLSSGLSTSSFHRRQQEGAKINQSLLSLSRVIYALSLNEDNQDNVNPDDERRRRRRAPPHIGFRDSKLTRILQPSLSGNAAMAVLCCVSGAKADITETKSTLKFATSAKRIAISPVVNELLLSHPMHHPPEHHHQVRANVSAVEATERDSTSLARLHAELMSVKQALWEFQERFQEKMTTTDLSAQWTTPGSKPLLAGRLAPGSAFSLWDSSMGSSEETPTLSPTPEEHRQQRRRRQQQSTQSEASPPSQLDTSSSSLAVLDTPTLSQLPVLPPLLPRHHAQQEGEGPQPPPQDHLPPNRFEDIDIVEEEQDSMNPPPPLTEVDISSGHNLNYTEMSNDKLVLSERCLALDEQRVNYMEERIEMTEALVERIYTEWTITKNALIESTDRHAELQKQLIQLQHSKQMPHLRFQDDLDKVDDRFHGLNEERNHHNEDEKEQDDSGFTWFISGIVLVCILFHVLGLRDFLISAIIFGWLSLQVIK